MPSLTDFELRTLPGVWNWYDHDSRKLGFPGGAREDVERWQAALRTELWRLMGQPPVDKCDLMHQVVEAATDEKLFRRERIVIQTLPGEYMPCYILTPNTPSPYKPIIALHGHGTGAVNKLAGVGEVDYHNAFARQFAELGYLVFVPSVRGFGERMEDEDLARSDDGWLSSCHWQSLNLLMTGKTLMGLRTWDTVRLIDYIQTRDDIQPETLGCVGISGGGALTLYTSALDTRITAAYMSCSMNTFRQSIMSINHCLCNYIPGILEAAEMSDIAGLIAPRPLMIEAGKDDPIFPIAGTQQAVDEIRRVYAVYGQPDRLSVNIFDGEHRWDGEHAAEWWARWL
jgi:dienelactone hydrolase